MQIDYLDYLPEEFKAAAVELYFSSLKEKLEPILGSSEKAQDALASDISADKCLVAVCDKKLVGILGI